MIHVGKHLRDALGIGAVHVLPSPREQQGHPHQHIEQLIPNVFVAFSLTSVYSKISTNAVFVLFSHARPNYHPPTQQDQRTTPSTMSSTAHTCEVRALLHLHLRDHRMCVIVMRLGCLHRFAHVISLAPAPVGQLLVCW